MVTIFGRKTESGIVKEQSKRPILHLAPWIFFYHIFSSFIIIIIIIIILLLLLIIIIIILIIIIIIIQSLTTFLIQYSPFFILVFYCFISSFEVW